MSDRAVLWRKRHRGPKVIRGRLWPKLAGVVALSAVLICGIVSSVHGQDQLNLGLSRGRGYRIDHLQFIAELCPMSGRPLEQVVIFNPSPHKYTPVASSHLLYEGNWDLQKGRIDGPLRTGERGGRLGLQCNIGPIGTEISVIKIGWDAIWEVGPTDAISHFPSWSRAAIGQLGMDLDNVSRNFDVKGFDENKSPLRLYEGISGYFCGFFGGIRDLFARPKKKTGSDCQDEREGGNNDSAKCGKKFVAGFDVAGKSFPIVVLFLIAGPAIGLVLCAFVSWWLGCGILFGWLGLVLFLLTLGVWF
jgi:hypothetical protein